MSQLAARGPSWLKLPRRTARLRLTALYGALFLLSGAALLAITYLLFEQAINGQATRSLGEPATRGVAVQLLAPSDQAQRAAQRASDLNQLLINSGIALAILAVLALVLGWLVAGRVLRPVQMITVAARRISASNLHERLALNGADEEFKQLGDTLDGLFARLEASFEAQRHFVANASHELRTPLTRERTLLQVALGDPSTSKMWQSTGQELLASNREQETLIEALLALASSEGGLDRREPIDLSVVADAVLLTPRSAIDRLRINVDTAITSAPLEGDPSLIERLVANLFDNAIGHNVVGGRVEVSTGTEDGNAVLAVTNTGPVIPSGEIDRLFQPFQRLDPRRPSRNDGHGLGLSIVRAIATAHDATITAHPSADGGLSVKVTFPPTRRDSNPQGPGPHNTVIAGSRPEPKLLRHVDR